jgi:hypothetical protein
VRFVVWFEIMVELLTATHSCFSLQNEALIKLDMSNTKRFLEYNSARIQGTCYVNEKREQL